ncbi:MAG: hypothetical protein JSW07_17915 [bacterium]|nr:MAG: hypothetical protein JSW07_17915 [bacterium]
MILFDAHVHIYDCFDIDKLFFAAFNNFKFEASRRSHGNDFTGVLLLAEDEDTNFFTRLKNYTKYSDFQLNKSLIMWKPEPAKEKAALWVTNELGEKLLITAGRQIVTKERLELLSLLTNSFIPGGDIAISTIRSVRTLDSIPVLPWSFGKWFGERGQAVANILKKIDFPGIFLGDIYSRPKIWPSPTHFEKAKGKGIRILAGTDPLNFATEQILPGRYGSIIYERLDRNSPVTHFKELLRDPSIQIKTYGNRSGLISFFLNQARLRLFKYGLIPARKLAKS